MLESKHIPSEYTELLMDVKQTESNIDIDNELTVFPPEDKEVFSSSRTTVFPILGGERLGTLVLGRVKDDFNENDLVLGEYAQQLLEWKYFVRNIMKLRKRHVIKQSLWQLIHYLILKKQLSIFLKN